MFVSREGPEQELQDSAERFVPSHLACQEYGSKVRSSRVEISSINSPFDVDLTRDRAFRSWGLEGKERVQRERRTKQEDLTLPTNNDTQLMETY